MAQTRTETGKLSTDLLYTSCTTRGHSPTQHVLSTAKVGGSVQYNGDFYEMKQLLIITVNVKS